jgi:hypothetical protein
MGIEPAVVISAIRACAVVIIATGITAILFTIFRKKEEQI